MIREGVMKKLILIVIVIFVIYGIFGVNTDKTPKPKVEYTQDEGLESNVRDIRETFDSAINLLSDSMDAIRRGWHSKSVDN